MITSLYKYLPLRESFFDNLLIRATSKLSLNDPFEVSGGVNFWCQMFRGIGSQAKGLTDDELQRRVYESFNSKYKDLDFGISLYRQYGIISLTETRDNLLMWSHYAEEHKGMVIEFDITAPFFSGQHSDGNDLVGSVNRVLYRKKRINELSNYYLEPYFVKSDEWLYEKEHRILLPNKNASEFWIHTKEYLELIKNKEIKESDISGEVSESIKILSNNKGNVLSMTNPHVMSMFEIPRKTIKSITFGSRCSQCDIDKIKIKLNENKFKDIELYISKLDHHDYKLNIERLD
nr:DUF2971 domain-containing protein [uncultured Vibrio sp.]